MKTPSSIVAALVLLASGDVRCASDVFGHIRCGSDVSKALVGRTMSNEPVAALQERHKDLGLEDLGGSEVSERLFLISWRICGDEYALLQEKDVVRDVLKFPPHSKNAPAFIGACQAAGKEMRGTVIAVLENRSRGEALPATAAWRIDEVRSKFVDVSKDGLVCPRDGIITADGGL